MLKWLFPTKKPYIDQNKVRVKKEAEDSVDIMVEYGTEEDFIAKAKKWNPNLTPQEIQRISILFRDAKRQRGQ